MGWLDFRAPELGDSRILRPGKLLWLRALAWMITLFVITIVASEPARAIMLEGFLSGGAPLTVVYEVLASLAVVGLYVLSVKVAENRWASELALRPAAGELALGIAAGAVLMAAIVGLLLTTGLYDLVGAPRESAWGAVAMAIGSGVTEEIIIRAVVLRLLMRAFGPWWGLALSSALFGALHLDNDDASLVAAASIAIEAGVLLGAVYLLTGRIWAAIGLHGSWNFTQSYIFGADVSGIASKFSLFAVAPNPSAPIALSGGDFGPEASLPSLVLATAAGLLTLLAAHRMGHLKIARPAPSQAADAF